MAVPLSLPRQAIYTRGSVGGLMLRNALSMVAGTLAMSGYNLVDAYFVGQMPGAAPLAAIGFTFPVILFFTFILRGVIVGVATVTAQALGAQNHERAQRVVSYGLALIAVVAGGLGVTGIATLTPVFHALGARGDALRLVGDYMFVWYLGSFTLAGLLAGNDLLLAVGKLKLASAAMVIGMVVNAILDPVLIFGWWGLPPLGLTGAAIATVLAQTLGMLMTLGLLIGRYHLARRQILPWRRAWLLWSIILRYGVPATLGMLVLPVGATLMTWITASFGDAAVAAVATATRLEQMAFVLPMAFGMTLTPVVGQNFGAKLYERIRRCRRFSMRCALVFLTVMAVGYFFLADFFAAGFTADAEVKRIMVLYLTIIPWGFGFIEVHRYAGFIYLGCGRPAVAAWLNVFRILGLIAPLSLLAWHWNWLPGVFGARLVADIIAGATGWYLSSRLTRRLDAPDGVAG
ncbi:MATE family efflux transporter [Planctomycetales bacterium]|nr:MATE family efflux transporter [Planctomycetales bacterium]GHT01286.1 MATE family efflux transporter [Planctomycetales bacterium]